jgi:hypothetical protein
MTSVKWRFHSAVFAAAASALASCALPVGDRASARTMPVASAADPQGRLSGYQRVRSYADRVKVGGQIVSRTVEYGFDYERRTTVRRTSDEQGSRVVEELLPTVTLRANDAESARMIELVRTHPQLGELMRRDDLHVHAGGFVVREPGDPYCDVGSRCLRVIVSSGDGSIPVIHAVVDLVSDRVVYPEYSPVTSRPPVARGNLP